MSDTEYPDIHPDLIKPFEIIPSKPVDITIEMLDVSEFGEDTEKLTKAFNRILTWLKLPMMFDNFKNKTERTEFREWILETFTKDSKEWKFYRDNNKARPQKLIHMYQWLNFILIKASAFFDQAEKQEFRERLVKLLAKLHELLSLTEIQIETREDLQEKLKKCPNLTISNEVHKNSTCEDEDINLIHQNIMRRTLENLVKEFEKLCYDMLKKFKK